MTSIKIYSNDSEPVTFTSKSPTECHDLRDKLQDTNLRYTQITVNHGKQITLFTAHITKIEVTP